jgi:hypothetical protein
MITTGRTRNNDCRTMGIPTTAKRPIFVQHQSQITARTASTRNSLPPSAIPTNKTHCCSWRLRWSNSFTRPKQLSTVRPALLADQFWIIASSLPSSSKTSSSSFTAAAAAAFLSAKTKLWAQARTSSPTLPAMWAVCRRHFHTNASSNADRKRHT